MQLPLLSTALVALSLRAADGVRITNADLSTENSEGERVLEMANEMQLDTLQEMRKPQIWPPLQALSQIDAWSPTRAPARWPPLHAAHQPDALQPPGAAPRQQLGAPPRQQTGAPPRQPPLQALNQRSPQRQPEPPPMASPELEGLRPFVAAPGPEGLQPPMAAPELEGLQPSMSAPGLPVAAKAANSAQPESPGNLIGKKAGLLAPDPIEPSISPGCYMRMPSGCPRQDGWRTVEFQSWQKDSWIGWKERKFPNGTTKTICEEERKAKLTAWCGANDVQTKYVDAMQAGSSAAPPPPMQEGCYVWAPGGCPRQPSFDSRGWRKGWARDSWPGWQERRVPPAQAAQTCKVERQFQLSGWCGSSVLTMWFSQEPQDPQAPGCYVHLPSGCPRKQYMFDARGFQSAWRADARGDEAPAATRETCGEDRRNQINNWCGTVDARVLLVNEAPPEPMVEGCHVWMPSGCPRQKKFDSSRYQLGWVVDAGQEWKGVHFTDINEEAKHSCSVERRQKLQEYCGINDVKTFYVGKAIKPPDQPGCYLMLPSGCPRQPKFDTSNWREQWALDQWHGWAEAGGRVENERTTICQEDRKKSMNDWCGTKDAKAVMVLG